MFELTISVNLEKQNTLQCFYHDILDEIKQDGGVCTTVNSGSRCKLALAVQSKKKEYYKAKILDFITNFIVDDYKYNYLKNSIFAGDTSVIYQSFLKAISIFDCDTDKEFIKNQLEISGEILIDSFYYFKLEPLRCKWSKTASIINQNGILKSNSSMIEVLKYLTTMSDNFTVTANINLSDGQIKLKNMDNSKTFECDFDGISSFFTEIIKLNPMKINIKSFKSDEKLDDIFELLSKIFSDKVYVES